MMKEVEERVIVPSHGVYLFYFKINEHAPGHENIEIFFVDTSFIFPRYVTLNTEEPNP